MDNRIQELKNQIGTRAKTTISNGLGLVEVNKKYRCPNSFAHKNADRDPSMSWHEQALHFSCFGCGMKIDIYGYYRDHLNYIHNEIMNEFLSDNNVDRFEKERCSFKDKLKQVTALTDDCKKYVLSRGINEEIIKKHSLKTYNGDIAFPYFKYESIVGYKTRAPKKDPGKPKMRSIPGSKPYLYNFQNLNNVYEELVICEGEFDCMILDQCGFSNVVSVGAGANSLGSLIEQSKDFLNEYENLIIVSDNDEAGSKMDEKFTEVFGDKARLIDKKLYTTNDVNEEHHKNGAQAIIELIQSARFKVAGRRDLDIDKYKGLTNRTGKYIPTGIGTLDYAINDLAPGCVTVVVGRTNAGKSTFVRQVMANAIDNDNKVFAVLGEGDQEIFINELYTNVIGRNNHFYEEKRVNKRTYKEPKREVLEALQEWHKGKLVLFNKGESKLKTMEQLFDIISYEIKFKNHNLVVLDNLMSLLTITSSAEKNDAQGNFVQRCCDIAKLYNTHIMIVVHPNKEYKFSRDLTIENISGTMDIGNKADNVIAVIRKYEDENNNENDDNSQNTISHSGEIKLLKNRYFSELPTVKTFFEKETNLLLEIKETNVMRYNFKWKTNLKVTEHSLHEQFAQKMFEQEAI